jgi:PAS domain S-box-containing protein
MDSATSNITEGLDAERARAELAAIVDSSADAIISKTLDGVIVSWNAAAERMYGYSASEVIGRSIMILIPRDQQDEIRKILERITRGESIEHLESPRLRKDGSQISISLTISPIKNGKGEIIGASAISHDTTDQKRAEQALRASEQLFRELTGNINEVFWLTDPTNTQMFYVSPAYETVWGRSCESLYTAPKSWMDAVYAEDKEHVLAAVGRQPCAESHDFTYRITRPDGSVRWIRDRGFPVRDESGEAVRFAGLADDITDSKQAEEALNQASRQLRNLSRRRIQVQEDERRHLARELHHHVGQLLTAGTLNLQLARRTKDRRVINGKLDETIAIFEEILQQVRQISFDIRPPVLDDLGLAPAMRWMLDDAAVRTDLASEFFADPDLKRGDVESETACYRVGLEAVLNVIRHARARKVWLELHNAGSALELVVRDDGIGFDVAAAEKRASRDRLGLVGMRERATALGGRFECKSTPGHGTEVRALFPVSSDMDETESL